MTFSLLLAHGVMLAEATKPVLSPPTNDFGLPSIAKNQSSEAAVQLVVTAVVNAVFALSATLAVAGVMYGGFLMITGGGGILSKEGVSSGGGIEKGKKAIMWSLLGLLVMAMAYSIVTIVTNVDPTKEDLGTGLTGIEAKP